MQEGHLTEWLSVDEAKQTECFWICLSTDLPQMKMDGGVEKRKGAKGLGQAVRSSVNCSPSSCIKFKGDKCAKTSRWSIVSKKKERVGGGALVWHTWSAHWAKWCHPSRWTQQFAIYFLINQTWGFFFFLTWWCVCVCVSPRVGETTAMLCHWGGGGGRPKMTSKLVPNCSPTSTSKMYSALFYIIYTELRQSRKFKCFISCSSDSKEAWLPSTAACPDASLPITSHLI